MAMTVKEDFEKRIANFEHQFKVSGSVHYKNIAECGRKILGNMSPEELARKIDERKESNE